ncbi:MAG: peptide MFS transporter [Rikenellaceae bacterium]|nr:peptide MFS transporter [Rikenellaceae bacterium]
MFKNHPKGLIAAALANMGERFGFYTMMAILVLFLQTKFGLDGSTAGIIYSTFYFSIYILAFVGGIIADRTRNFNGTILAGLLFMALGYVLIAIPSQTPVPDASYKLMLTLTCIGLFVIAFGNGLFKGNLQALVGKMYDNEKYDKMRDSGFSIFYMFINVGAIFAPLLAVAVRNWWVKACGFVYNADAPTWCQGLLAGTLEGEGKEKLAQFAAESGYAEVPLEQFAGDYLNVFTTGFHYAFGCAIFAMLISLWIFLANKKKFPGVPKKAEAAKDAATGKPAVEMSVKEIRQRMYALFAVFAVVIFFWFSFHQNGLTLTMFAKEFTDLSAMKINLGVTTIEGAEVFQSINPLCVVLLTPIIVGLFGWLRSKGKEPSAPGKIAIGMGIAALGFVVMAVGSYVADLPLWSELFQKVTGADGKEVVNTIKVLPEAAKVTPLLLIGTYIILTIAELFISPLGISFVSKVAPPHLQGVMQGGWLAATALGNQLLVIGAILYESIPIWMTWTVFVVACTLSMCTMLAMLKWLERVTK